MRFKWGHLRPYSKWSWNVKNVGESFNVLPTGVGGVLYPPHSLHPDVENSDLFMKLTPRADDIWFWAMAVRNNTKITITPGNRLELDFVDGSQDVPETLNKQNVSGGQNDIQMKNILKYYPEVYSKLDRKGKNAEYLYKKSLPLYELRAKNGVITFSILGIRLYKFKRQKSRFKCYLLGIRVWQYKYKK